MEIRRYIEGEEAEIGRLFYNTIHKINSKDYHQDQINAWAPEPFDLHRVAQKIRTINPYVVILDGKIVAYADIQADGYIDHFFCHHDYQGMGIGRRLFAKLARTASENGVTELYANVSITARPFFEAMGFSVEKTQTVKQRDQVLINYRMVRIVNLRSHSKAR